MSIRFGGGVAAAGDSRTDRSSPGAGDAICGESHPAIAQPSTRPAIHTSAQRAHTLDRRAKLEVGAATLRARIIHQVYRRSLSVSSSSANPRHRAVPTRSARRCDASGRSVQRDDVAALRGVSAFVAHDNIEPMTAWQHEILKGDDTLAYRFQNGQASFPSPLLPWLREMESQAPCSAKPKYRRTIGHFWRRWRVRRVLVWAVLIVAVGCSDRGGGEQSPAPAPQSTAQETSAQGLDGPTEVKLYAISGVLVVSGSETVVPSLSTVGIAILCGSLGLAALRRLRGRA